MSEPVSVARNTFDHTLTALLDRCASGDEAGLEQLYRLSSPVILTLLRQRTGSVAEAESALVATYVEVWRRAPDRSWTGEAPLAWVARIAFDTV